MDPKQKSENKLWLKATKIREDRFSKIEIHMDTQRITVISLTLSSKLSGEYTNLVGVRRSLSIENLRWWSLWWAKRVFLIYCNWFFQNNILIWVLSFNVLGHDSSLFHRIYLVPYFILFSHSNFFHYLDFCFNCILEFCHAVYVMMDLVSTINQYYVSWSSK